MFGDDLGFLIACYLRDSAINSLRRCTCVCTCITSNSGCSSRSVETAGSLAFDLKRQITAHGLKTPLCTRDCVITDLV